MNDWSEELNLLADDVMNIQRILKSIQDSLTNIGISCENMLYGIDTVAEFEENPKYTNEDMSEFFPYDTYNMQGGMYEAEDLVKLAVEVKNAYAKLKEDIDSY